MIVETGDLQFQRITPATIVSRAATKGGARKLRRGGPENKNFALTPKLLSMPPQTPRMVAFFVGDQQRTRRNLDRVGAMTFFFVFGDQQTQKFLPLLPQEKNFAPLGTAF